MDKPVFIFSHGEIHRKQNTIYFMKDSGEKKFIPVENTKELHIFGEVIINKDVLEFFSKNEIILHFYNYYGYYAGSFYPREHYNSGFMILKQAEHYLDPLKRLTLAKTFVKGAIQNTRKVLSYYNSRGIPQNEIIEKIEKLENEIPKQPSVEALMAIEGNVKDIYYGTFNNIANSEGFEMKERTRRPPENRMNALISFGNSLLYVTILSEIYKTHLDPRIGFLHTTNFRRFTLNLDVAEVFKPIIIDRLIFYLVNKKMIEPSHFETKLGGLYLKDKGRGIFVKKYDEKLNTTIKHKKIGKVVSYRRLLRLELYKIEKHLIGDDEYEPFNAEW